MYSFKESSFEGHPFLILFKDGDSVFREAEHIRGFKFGIKKAKMIINTMVQIEDFCDTNGLQPPNGAEICIPPGKYDISCYCRKCNGFRIGDFVIEKPYLKIWSNNIRIGFGLVKAEGLITLKNQIEDFIRRNDNRM